MNKLSVKALPKDLPASIEVDISNLDLNKSIKVSEANTGNVTILSNPSNPIATITVPRGLKSDAAAEDPKAAGGKKK